MRAAAAAAQGSAAAAAAAAAPARGGGASNYLANLPSRGLLSSTTLLSSNPGGIRVYLCDHDTAPPEDQLIKTSSTNILIRALQMNKQKNDSITKAAPEHNKGKRCAVKTLEGQSPIKRANTTGASGSARQDGKTPVKKANTTSSSGSTRQEGSSSGASEKIYQTMTVERLRTLLKERGLPTKGKKDELIARLRG